MKAKSTASKATETELIPIMTVAAAFEATFELALPIFHTVLVSALRPATPSFEAPFTTLDALLTSAPVTVSTAVMTVVAAPALIAISETVFAVASVRIFRIISEFIPKVTRTF